MNSEDFLRESARTASGTYHADKVPPPEIDFMLQAVMVAGAWADRVKRALFYGSEIKLRTGASNTSVTHKPELAK